MATQVKPMALVLCAAMMLVQLGAAQCPSCGPNALTADYANDRVPDAAKDAYTTIELNQDSWEVEFRVKNVKKITNGHVIAHSVDNRAVAQDAFTPYVSAWNATQLWNPPACELGSLDSPNGGLGIAVTNHDNCTRDYLIRYSLINTLFQNTQHCDLNVAGTDIVVNCSLMLSATRAYDLTEPNAFLSTETFFAAEITMSSQLNNVVNELMYATLAKCSVLNGPLFVIDCRVPGLWSFVPGTFVSTTTPNSFITDNTCVQAQTASPQATYIRCQINGGVATQTYTEVAGNLTAQVALPPAGQNITGQSMSFSLVYSLPREATATASASLGNFVKSITTLNAKYYYAGADTLTLQIEVVDTSRLVIDSLSMFNAQGQSYDLRARSEFLLTENQNASYFIITFRPSAIRADSAFYRNGPHGINVSFTFTSASRRQNGGGFVNYDGMKVQDPSLGEAPLQAGPTTAATTTGSTSSSNVATTTAGASSSSTVIIASVAAAVAVTIGVIAAVVVVRKGKKAPAQAQQNMDAAI